jgi:hypothetical protein
MKNPKDAEVMETGETRIPLRLCDLSVSAVNF